MRNALFLILAMIVGISPYFRGLFFPMEQLPFALGITVLFILCFITSKQRVSFSPTDWAVLGLSIAYFLAIPTAVNRYTAVLTALLTLAPTLVYFAASRHARDPKHDFSPALTLFSASAGVVAFLGILNYAHMISFIPAGLNGDRLASFFQYANTTGAFFGLAIILTLGQMVGTKRLVSLVLCAANVFILTVAFVLTFSRGALLTFPLALIIYLTMLPNEYKVQAVTSTVGIGLSSLWILKPLQTAINAKQPNHVWMWLVYGVLLAGLSGLVTYGLSAAVRRVFQTAIVSSRAVKRTAMAIVIVVIIFSALPVATRLAGAIQSIPTRSSKRISDISLETNSVWVRFMFMQNGARIALQHPLGVGGGGYASLYSITQDVQVIARLAHSHPIQVWVEAGIIGLIAYLLIWGSSLFSALRFLVKERSASTRARATSILCAAGALGLHSLIDFDMSFLSIQLWIFLLLGLLRGMTDQPKETERPPLRLSDRVATAAVVVPAIIAGMVMVPLARAEWENYWGCEAYEQGRYDVAITRLEHAVNMVPFNAKYHHDLANAYLAQNMTVANYAKARQAAEQAVRHDPYAYEHHYLLLGIQIFQMDYMPAVEEAKTLLMLQPKAQKNYDLAAPAYAYGLVELARSGDRDRVAALAKEVATWPDKYRNEVSKLTVTKDVSLALGTAHFFLGNWQDAERYFTNSEQNNFMRPEIYRWLALIYEKSGNKTAFNKLVSKVPYLKMTFINGDYQMLLRY